jgi:uncharacterized protein YecA (UPF0149 family)
MAKVKRNEPCPCGSGIKAKRCQPTHRFIDIRVLPLELCDKVVNDLVEPPKPRCATSSIR